MKHKIKNFALLLRDDDEKGTILLHSVIYNSMVIRLYIFTDQTKQEHDCLGPFYV